MGAASCTLHTAVDSDDVDTGLWLVVFSSSSASQNAAAHLQVCVRYMGGTLYMLAITNCG